MDYIDYILTLDRIYLLPVIGALIGWVTNYLAVKMLFHPKKRVRLLFFSIQGVFPKRQAAFAHKLGVLVSKELISVEEVTKRLTEQASSDELVGLITSRIKTIIALKLPAQFPVLAMFLTPELIESITESFVPDLKSLLEELINKLTSGLEEELDVHQLVEEKVASFSVEKLEEIIFSIMKREFRFIEFIGAVIGALIGGVQVMLLG